MQELFSSCLMRRVVFQHHAHPCFVKTVSPILTHVTQYHCVSIQWFVVLQMHAVSIHTNVVGGMTMSEPANDLAIAVAIASSYYEQPFARDIVCIGEVGESFLRIVQSVLVQQSCPKQMVMWLNKHEVSARDEWQ